MIVDCKDTAMTHQCNSMIYYDVIVTHDNVSMKRELSQYKNKISKFTPSKEHSDVCPHFLEPRKILELH